MIKSNALLRQDNARSLRLLVELVHWYVDQDLTATSLLCHWPGHSSYTRWWHRSLDPFALHHKHLIYLSLIVIKKLRCILQVECQHLVHITSSDHLRRLRRR